jgi:peroxiredoxin 2/4
MPNNKFRVGEPAPDFNLKGVLNGNQPEDFKLTDYRGRWVVLFFYPLDFSIVCPTEIKEFSQRFDEFDHYDAAVLGVSTQNIDSHAQWLAKLGEIRYPLLADPEYTASQAYNTLIPAEGVALRGTFIIDPRGVLRYALYHDNAIGRSVTETLRVLAALRTGEMCPAEWQPGEATIAFRDNDTSL